MVISHNTLAMNAARINGINNLEISKLGEKLSSGYRINRAADDAAGLSISEKMRRQIRGLNQASENVQDGISLLQVADGAMAEIHEMIQRGNELSVQAANGTLSDTERAYIQLEIDALTKEIDSIAHKTTFNGIPILQAESFINGGNVAIKGSMPVWVDTGPSTPAGFLSETYYTTETYKETDAAGNTVTKTASIPHEAAVIDLSNFTGTQDQIDELTKSGFYSTCCTCSDHYSISFVDSPNSIRETSGNHYIFKIGIQGASTPDELMDRIIAGTNNGRPNNHYTKIAADKTNGKLIVYDDRSNAPSPVGGNVQWQGWSNPNFNIHAGPGSGQFGVGVATSLIDAAKKGNELQIMAGEDAIDVNIIKLDLPAVSSLALGLNTLSVRTQPNARNAIATFGKALEYVSQKRSGVGSYQNRLEHTLSNLNNISENTQSAESLCRDTDMSKEMVAYSNLSILLQSNEAMMAQANKSKEDLVNLLKY